MAEERLSGKDLRVLLLWVLLGLAGAGVASKYFFAAFPEAAVDFRVSRPAAVEAARRFLVAQGQKVEGYQSSIVFALDEDAKTYLEREVGLEQANRLMASEVGVWYWDVRFFRPLQKEEFKVRISPAGRAVGYEHIVEEARPGAQLEQEAARAKADQFLRASYAANLAAYDYLPEEANKIEKPKRRDWRFTWERRGFKAPARENGAPYRLRVTLQGDEIGGAEEFLKVPEAWKRDFERLRSSNIFYQIMAEVFLVLLFAGMTWMLYELSRRGLVHWRWALAAGLLVAFLLFISDLNEWPLTRAAYDTNTSYSGFFLERTGLALLSSLAVALLLMVLPLAAGEPLYRRDHPKKLRLAAAFTLPGIRSKEFFRSSVIGVSMAAAHIGFAVLFYLIGRHFGVWAPQDIKYTNVVSTALPWVYPLTIGVFAATSEEFLFRLFSIAFLLRFTKSRWVAVILPAFIWGFLHSAYPQEPGYIRGIEVGLIGIVAGVVMLRWGILTTLIWHYTVDAFLISLFLLRSESTYFRVSGAIVGAAALIPLAIAGAFYLARRGFEPDEALVNRADPLVETAAAPAKAEVATQAQGYEALDRRAVALLAAAAVLGAILLVGVKAKSIGDFARLQIDAREAAARADDVLRQRKLDPRTYKHAATIVDTFNLFANEYLRRQVGMDGVNRIYQEKVPSVFWRVRYFRDSQKEEYAVILRTDGALHSVHHELEEKAAGAALSKEDAMARAEAYLRQEKKLDLTKWKLVEAVSDKRPARTDHTFTWEEIAPLGDGFAAEPDKKLRSTVAEPAHARIEVQVQGEEVSRYRIFVKIPEQWQRWQSERTLGLIVHTVWRYVFAVALGITALVIFFMNLKTPSAASIPWRRLLGWAAWGLLAALVTTVNALPQVLAMYPTEFSLKKYMAIIAISWLVLVSVIGSALFFLFGLAWFYLSRAFGEARLPSWTGMPAAYYRDALLVALGGSIALMGLDRLPYLLARLWPTARRALDAGAPLELATYVPAAQSIGGTVSHSLFLTGLVALVAGFVAACVRPRWLRVLLVVLAALAMVGSWGSPAHFAKQALLNLIALGVLWWGVTRVVRFNLLGYFLLVATMTLLRGALELLQQPNSFFRANGYAVVAFLLALLIWPLVAWRRAGPSAA